jgi:hypothetical protein
MTCLFKSQSYCCLHSMKISPGDCEACENYESEKSDSFKYD